MDPSELNQAVSMVFQDVRLFNDTVLNNIALGREGAGLQEVWGAAQKALAHDFIMALPRQYETVIGEGGGRLSRGQRQRIAIARALLKDSPIVLLDEATASLDPESQRMIQKSLASLMHGRTVVVIAHRLETITEADAIVVLGRDGTVAGQGRHQSLLRGCPLYKELWEARLQAGGWRLGGEAPGRICAPA
jgi:ATP-binding cassette subfamily B protein